MALIAIALVGCTENPVAHDHPLTPALGYDRATVTGHVVDADGAVVPGATVTVRATGEHDTADSNGAFVIDVPANTTLTLAATAPSMATTLMAQFMIAPAGTAMFTIPLITAARLANLNALGPNRMGGVAVIAVKPMSGGPTTAEGVTVDLAPSELGRVLYAPESSGMPDPDPSLTSMVPGSDCMTWALGVQPHVSIMTLTLRGVSQVEPPNSIDDITWPGTFTIDAGALTYITLFTP